MFYRQEVPNFFKETTNALGMRKKANYGAEVSSFQKPLETTLPNFLLNCGPLATTNAVFSWKGGREVECAGLEIRYTVIPYRGFESHPFRQE